MRAFEIVELERMQAVHLGALMDRCELLQRVTGATDAYGYAGVTWAVVGAVACGLSHSPTVGALNREGMRDTEVPLEDRVLRLPAGTVVAPTWRVRVTHRFGVPEAEPEIYELIGAPQAGPAGLVCGVRRVTEGA